MRKGCVFALLLLTASCAQQHDPVRCPHRGAPYAPPGFGSRGDADLYVRALSAGGRVALLKAGAQSVLVVYVHGMGIPDLAIAAYRASGGHWLRAAEWSGGPAEAHSARLDRGAVVVVGERSGFSCVLIAAGEQAPH